MTGGTSVTARIGAGAAGTSKATDDTTALLVKSAGAGGARVDAGSNVTSTNGTTWAGVGAAIRESVESGVASAAGSTIATTKGSGVTLANADTLGAATGVSTAATVAAVATI